MIDRLREKRLHGSSVFPFEHYCMKTEKSNIFVPCHWHEEAEIVIIKSGETEFIADGVRIILNAGDAAFVNPQQIHQYAGLTSSTEYDACVFSLKSLLFAYKDKSQSFYIEPLLKGSLRFPQVIRSDSPINKEIRRTFSGMINFYHEKNPGWELAVKISLYEIICILIRYNLLSGSKIIEKDTDTCKRLLEYLDAHLSEDITVAEISRYICMSPNYFSAYFTKHFGRSFVKYMTGLRIEHACILLLSTPMSVTEIAVNSGFENTSYFIRKFRELTGCTPLEYRKKGADVPGNALRQP